MGPDAANLAGSVAKSLEVERSPNVTQRGSEIAQEQLISENTEASSRIKSDAAEQLRRMRMRQERERRRRELERRGLFSSEEDDQNEDDDAPGLDVVV